MDISPNRGKKKNPSGSTSGKQSRDKPAPKASDKYYYLEGERIEIADDLLDLPEVDYDDPEVKKWLAEEDARFRKKYPDLTYEEAERYLHLSFDEVIKMRGK